MAVCLALQPLNPGTAISHAATVMAANDDDDLDASLRMPVRRLHPERQSQTEAREQTKAEKRRAKQLAEQQKARERAEQYERLAAQKAGRAYLTPAEREERDSRERASLDSLLAIDYTLPDYSKYFRLTWKDEPVNESNGQLAEHLQLQDLQGGAEQRYCPRDVSMDSTSNALYFYFDMKNGRPEPLRLRAQYCADDPLGIAKVSFVINGYDYSFTPSNTQAGKSGSRLFWENFDQRLTAADKDLVYALAHCKWARVIYVGDRGFNHVKKLTPEQIKDFYYTLSMYRKLGGRL